MSIFKKWFNNFISIFSKDRVTYNVNPSQDFLRICKVEKPPKNIDVVKGKIYFVVSQEKPKWALFHCPCGCKSVITLSLQTIHKPHWSLTHNKENLASLYPSVWRDVGCYSHFWLKDGSISWCSDSGTKPLHGS